MIVMGKCTGCGKTQPGEETGDSVEPLAEDGCANCGDSTFIVAEEEEDAATLTWETTIEANAPARSD